MTVNIVSSTTYNASNPSVTLLGTGSDRAIVVIPYCTSSSMRGITSISIDGVAGSEIADEGYDGGIAINTGVYLWTDAQHMGAGSFPLAAVFGGSITGFNFWVVELENFDQSELFGTPVIAKEFSQNEPHNAAVTLNSWLNKEMLVFTTCADGVTADSGGFITSVEGLTIVDNDFNGQARIGGFIESNVASNSETYNFSVQQTGTPNPGGPNHLDSIITILLPMTAIVVITPPVLSTPTGTETGDDTADGTVTTNEADGILYYYVSINSSESAAAIKSSGSNQAVTSSGVQNVSVSSLTPSTNYYLHYVHDDAGFAESNVVSSPQFTTEAPQFGISSVSNSSPLVGEVFTANLAEGTGPYTATYKGQTLIIDDEDSSHVDIIWPDLGELGDLSANFNIAYPLIITDTDDSDTDTISITTLVEVGAEFGQITLLESGGLYENDIDALIGDFSYIFDITGDVEIDVETGLFSNNLPSTASYRLFRTNWSDPAANAIFDGIPIPVIVTQPIDGSVIIGDSNSVKTFIVSATDLTNERTYQWEFSDDSGSNYSDSVGETSATLDVSGDEFADITNDGRLYRCVVSNVGGSVTSATASLSLLQQALPVIITQPLDGAIQVANLSSTHEFSITATDTISYQWEFSDNAVDFGNVVGATSNTLVVSGDEFADTANTGRLYRCRAINNIGSTISSSAELTLLEEAQTAPVITSQPSSGQVQAQNLASSHGFVVVATDANSYQWQLSDNGGSSYSDILGSVSPTVVASGDQFVDDLLSGRLYRCNVTNGVGVTVSSAATLTITPAAVSETAFVIGTSNPVVDCDDNLVTHTYATWELRDKPMWDPTNVIIDSGVSFAVVAGSGSTPTPNAVLNTNYEFSARDAGDNPSNFIRVIGMVI